jgi:hypothetical protein
MSVPVPLSLIAVQFSSIFVISLTATQHARVRALFSHHDLARLSFPHLIIRPSATTSKLPLLLDRGFSFRFQFPLQSFSLRICSLRFCLFDSLGLDRVVGTL